MATNTTTGRALRKDMDKGITAAAKFWAEWQKYCLLKNIPCAKILPTDHAWSKVKKGEEMLTQFCEDYEIERSAATPMFLDALYSLMGKRMNITKIGYKKTKLFELFEAYLMISNDDAEAQTHALIRVYEDKVLRAAKVKLDMFLKADEYVKFVYARIEADAFEASYEDWIDAQTAGLKQFDIFPSPKHLFGAGAEQRWKDSLFKGAKDYKPSGSELLLRTLEKRRNANQD